MGEREREREGGGSPARARDEKSAPEIQWSGENGTRNGRTREVHKNGVNVVIVAAVQIAIGLPSSLPRIRHLRQTQILIGMKGLSGLNMSFHFLLAVRSSQSPSQPHHVMYHNLIGSEHPSQGSCVNLVPETRGGQGVGIHATLWREIHNQPEI